MKNQPFFTKFKKIITYPFSREFIRLQKSAIKLLDEKCNEYYNSMREKHFEDDDWTDFGTVANLRNDLNKCWDLHDVTLFLAVEISKVLKNKINMRIFDLKTKWFLWQDIFLRVDLDLIQDPAIQETTKNQLKLLHELSSIFDLGK